MSANALSQTISATPHLSASPSASHSDTPALVIEGGRKLSGTVRVGGAKNATLPILAASLLADGPLEIGNAPDLLDIETMIALLQGLGVSVMRQEKRLVAQVVDARPFEASQHCMARMRAGFCVLGPLLARRGEAVVPLPGGCEIGARPVDLHLKGLSALGAELRLDGPFVRAKAKRLRGATIDMLGPCGSTVTGTANVLCAAVLAEGETTIRNAAREPEIVELATVLKKMGARITGEGTSLLRIEGVRRLDAAQHVVAGDRIEAATFLMAAAITGSTVRIEGVDPRQLTGALPSLRATGIDMVVEKNAVSIFPSKLRHGLQLTAAPYPGTPTDLQAQWTALLCMADESSVVRDDVFPSRFAHVRYLRRMGARIQRRGNRVLVSPGTRFQAAEVRATDLRAGAALVLAALAADGTTVLHDATHLDRGYERLADKLNALGADVRRVTVRESRSAG